MPKSKWNPYEDGISYSALCKFINDRERFRIRAVEGLAPGGISEAIEFGSLFHKLIEWYAEGYTTPSRLNSKMQRNLRGADEATKKLAKQAITVMLCYMQYWDDSDKRYIEQEAKFRVPITLSTGHTIPIIGRRDGVYRLKDYPEVGNYLQENKTKGRIDVVQLENALPHNMQTMMYSYSLWHDYGVPPAGVLYNVIRRPQLRQRQRETDTQFNKRIQEDIESRPEHYFIRHQLDFGPNDIHNFVDKVLIPVLEQMCLWWESIKHNPFDPWTLPDGSVNPHHFLRPFGVYDDLVHGRGDYFDYITRDSKVGLVEVETLFPELVED